MRARAYAKVNLGLEVLFRRQDGYHELRTILQTVDL
ncbi:MAG TPA: 4-(cytidine 5'-diphospho)-2-C-methyl-D-erythritol kinase, partial [Vicinamibacteria bacterium]|nr:4-(cytidine 5'-diphospho)-2-C-methyl-D-erythritol kinase [Vicinamibacteria bacterium]